MLFVILLYWFKFCIYYMAVNIIISHIKTKVYPSPFFFGNRMRYPTFENKPGDCQGWCILCKSYSVGRIDRYFNPRATPSSIQQEKGQSSGNGRRKRIFLSTLAQRKQNHKERAEPYERFLS